MDRQAQEPSVASATPTAVPSSLPTAGPGLGACWRPGLAPLTAPLPHFRRPAARLLCRGLMLTLGQLVEVEHRERLAAVPEPAIFALNHRNALEALLAPTVLLYLRHGAPLHFLADWMYLEAPGLGWLLRQAEPIAVYGKPARFRLRESHRRERLRRPVLDACREILGRGESIGIFPEGTRNRNERRLLRGRLGLGELALTATVPVVPVAIRYRNRETTRELNRETTREPNRAPNRETNRAPDRTPDRPPGLGRMVLSIGEPLDFAAERRQLATARTSAESRDRRPAAAPPVASRGTIRWSAAAPPVASRGTICWSEPRPGLRRELARRVVDQVMAALAGALGNDYRPWRGDQQRVPRAATGGAAAGPPLTPSRTAEATCE
ncbi:MAG TPA: 1-acyl-sn-glycerol-3-phosphate acyltransferase [Thermoanaerobaculia bacterium]|nr:1-acyl-sn-glycerol-3-phosphate acyltransferase [Thermoanaerobaculia bacterium]